MSSFAAFIFGHRHNLIYGCLPCKFLIDMLMAGGQSSHTNTPVCQTALAVGRGDTANPSDIGELIVISGGEVRTLGVGRFYAPIGIHRSFSCKFSS